MGERNKMKILLINPPLETFSMFTLDDYSKKARSHQVPLWALYLHSHLKNQHNIKIIDMAAKEMSIKDIKSVIDEFSPDLIGITCVISKVIVVRELSKFIKDNFRIPICVGGVHASLYPYEMLSLSNIDFIISGFGQMPLEKLCYKLEMKHSVDDIPNVHTKRNCTKKGRRDFCFEDVDKYPMPDRSILDINDYTMPFFSDGNPVTSSITSFGCPYKCRYCACRGFKPLILRKPEKIIEEMKHIESLGIKGLLFNDELFTLNKSRISEICSLIISEKINLKISLRSRANLINKDSLELLKDAGVFNIHIGAESGNDRILKAMNKQLTVDTIRKSVKTIKSVGLGVTGSFMIGYKSENEEEILNTIEFAKELELDVSQFYVTCTEPNTPLYNELKEIKNLPEDIYSDFTMNPGGIDLTQNVASTLFTKKDMDEYLKYAYTQTKNLYKMKENENNI